MMASRSAKLRMMNVSVRVPSMMGDARNEGAQITVNSGTCRLSVLGAADLHEHVAREQAVPGLLGDDADGHAVVRIGAGVAVLHEDVAALQEALHAA